MPEVARVRDLTVCPTLLPLPHIGGALVQAMPVCMDGNSVPIIRLGDFSNCLIGPQDVVAEGAANFTVCGLPVARKGDHMIHGGVIITASSNIEIGGPSFRLPRNVKIKGPPSFQNETIRDMYLIWTTPSGRDLIDQLGSAGHPVEIVPESDPHNSFCSANDYGDATNGNGTGSTVKYNPNAGILVFDDAGNTISMPPQPLLAHELAHALHNAHGDNATGDPDPNGPATQPDIEKEEAYAIGTGSYDGTSPSENSLRADLGLPRRDNHYGTTTDASGNELTGPTENLRPGSC